MNIAVMHIWIDDFGERLIPAELVAITVFRKDGWPDQRCKIRNRPFMVWLGLTWSSR